MVAGAARIFSTSLGSSEPVSGLASLDQWVEVPQMPCYQCPSLSLPLGSVVASAAVASRADAMALARVNMAVALYLPLLGAARGEKEVAVSRQPSWRSLLLEQGDSKQRPWQPWAYRGTGPNLSAKSPDPHYPIRQPLHRDRHGNARQPLRAGEGRLAPPPNPRRHHQFWPEERVPTWAPRTAPATKFAQCWSPSPATESRASHHPEAPRRCFAPVCHRLGQTSSSQCHS